MTDPEVTWTEQFDGSRWRHWTAHINSGSGRATIRMRVEETKNHRLPFDVYVSGNLVGFKKTLEAAKACAVRQAKLRLEAEENAK